MRNKQFYKKKKKKETNKLHNIQKSIKPIVDREKPRIRVYI